MAPLLTIDADASRLIAILDQLGPAALKHTKAAARVTADNIAREAAARVARATGETARGITVQEDQQGEGYVVLSANQRMPALPTWLEFGTVKMLPKSYFFSSARLEENAHDRRMRQAIQDASDEVNG